MLSAECRATTFRWGQSEDRCAELLPGHSPWGWRLPLERGPAPSERSRPPSTSTLVLRIRDRICQTNKRVGEIVPAESPADDEERNAAVERPVQIGRARWIRKWPAPNTGRFVEHWTDLKTASRTSSSMVALLVGVIYCPFGSRRPTSSIIYFRD